MKKLVLTSLIVSACSLAIADNKQNTENTIDKIKRTNTIIIGHRSSSIPFSYYDGNKQPIGFTIDICSQIVDTIKKQYNLPSIEIKYIEVNGDTRLPFVEDGKIDLECGSTTNNADRRKRVDFSIPFYVAGVKFMGRAEDKLESVNSVKGKKVVVVNGTTAGKTVDNLNKTRLLNLSKVEANDYNSALKLIIENKADLVIADDILLYGERSKLDLPESLAIIPSGLSVEPLAIMMRKNDKQLNQVVNKHIIKIMENGEFNRLYKKWFVSPIYPSNKSLNIPMNELLFDIVRFPTHITGN